MLILLLTLVAIVIPGALAAFVAYRWPQAALTAPKVSTETVKTEVRRHPREASFVRSRLDPSSATGLLLTAAVVVVVAGAAGVGIVLLMIHTNSGFARLDRSASLFGAHHATNLSTHVLRWYTQLGGALVIVPLGVVVAIVEWIRQRSLAVVTFLVLVVGGQFLVANIIKNIVGRARPTFDQLTGFSGTSFPSGHAVASAACLAAFALVIGRRRSLLVRSLLTGLAVGLATGIAWTRVMLGVHWLTDVLGGLALGWAWFALCSIAYGGYQLRFGAPAKTAAQAVATQSTQREESR
ncbi:MAG TPA: phosphatase PAP2 family protein [Acidimicrobiales bacterium]|jgi:undecaprenyl-diphosphatase|nr:phosphatase PAP2 family protein [Acidimicrobiales bacterium]